jgi:hypothetical protein
MVFTYEIAYLRGLVLLRIFYKPIFSTAFTLTIASDALKPAGMITDPNTKRKQKRARLLSQS